SVTPERRPPPTSTPRSSPPPTSKPPASWASCSQHGPVRSVPTKMVTEWCSIGTTLSTSTSSPRPHTHCVVYLSSLNSHHAQSCHARFFGSSFRYHFLSARRDVPG